MADESASPVEHPLPAKNRGGAPLGNRNGAVFRRAAAALKKACDQAEKAPNCTYTLHKIMVKMLKLAAAGDVEAAKVVFDRLDGKAAQTLDITHNKGPTLLHAEQARALASSFLEAQRINDANEATLVAGEVIDKAREP